MTFAFIYVWDMNFLELENPVTDISRLSRTVHDGRICKGARSQEASSWHKIEFSVAHTYKGTRDLT